MAQSTLINTFFGLGTLANRPAASQAPAGCILIYYATDTTQTFVSDGSTWTKVAGP